MNVAKKSALAVVLACTAVAHAAPAPRSDSDDAAALDAKRVVAQAELPASAATAALPADEQQTPAIPEAVTYVLLGLGMALIGLSTQWRQRR